MMLSKSVKTFFISFGLVFLMTAIPHLNLSIKTGSLISPLPQKPDVLEKVKLKLNEKKSSFELKKQFIKTAQAGSDYDQSEAYGVIDFDSGEVMLSKNLSKKLPMASLTKVMTAVVALDLAESDEEFTVSERASSQIPTKVMLKKGEKYPLWHLLSSLIISSANDSAEVIKEKIDAKYGQGVFTGAMNEKAKILGLKNTNFTNPQGFDNPNNYSSIEDLAVLSHYAMTSYPLIEEIAGKEFEDLTNNRQDLRFYLNNWNGLMGVYPGVSGIKIGNTDKAGRCTIVLSEREGKNVLIVLLGAPGVLERDLWASRLLDLGFAKLANLPPVNVTEEQLREKYSTWQYF